MPYIAVFQLQRCGLRTGLSDALPTRKATQFIICLEIVIDAYKQKSHLFQWRLKEDICSSQTHFLQYHPREAVCLELCFK